MVLLPFEVFVLSVCFCLAPSRVRVLPKVKSGIESAQSSIFPAACCWSARSLLVNGPSDLSSWSRPKQKLGVRLDPCWTCHPMLRRPSLPFGLRSGCTRLGQRRAAPSKTAQAALKANHFREASSFVAPEGWPLLGPSPS
ncbi:hypothetical protein B0T10DRAFT_114255 [Thelonectria olida]|uniref:Secreted protein n=1 Tax=Thelonectria olida TaxID=1576542 RepID=A0A9P8WGP4_9HYPO|nr:hypothetical protein B0T10DRAFT_114255 [Thelonectria olida]